MSANVSYSGPGFPRQSQLSFYLTIPFSYCNMPLSEI